MLSGPVSLACVLAPVSLPWHSKWHVRAVSACQYAEVRARYRHHRVCEAMRESSQESRGGALH
eukprot:7618920-Alexandrium_andersonii.AAC.1